MKFTSLSVAAAMAAVTQVVCAATKEDKHNFKSFHKLMKQHNYDWEVYTTNSEDGYELNMFRLVGPIHVDPVKT